MIQDFFIADRVNKLDPDFLAFEEEMLDAADKRRIESLIRFQGDVKLPNPYNSCILYALGLTDDFDFKRARSETVGGSPPDIDIDIPKLRRQEALDLIVNRWGRDNVANITTYTTMGPRSIIERYFKVTEGPSAVRAELTKLIPPDKFGKAASFQEMLEAHPVIEQKYASFANAAKTLDGLVSSFGVHASGIVISDFPIKEVVPTLSNSKFERVTQWDMHETEHHGLIKFDFLGITTLSILEECVSLILKNRGEAIDIFSIEDGDEKTYEMLGKALLAGIFQMETSGVVKPYFTEIQPKSIEEIAAITSINRPGPQQAGLDAQYIEYKKSGNVPDIPEDLKEILRDTNYTLLYQEQVMAIVSRLAGFTLLEADDIRRAMGKKKKEVLEAYEAHFVSGCKQKGITVDFAQSLWQELIGFADYCFAGDTVLANGDTMYETVSNPKKPILSYRSKRISERPVARRYAMHATSVKDQCYEYTFTDGSKVRCTSGQKFLTIDGKMVDIDTIYSKGLSLKRVNHVEFYQRKGQGALLQNSAERSE